jgi:hypothetical protein
MGFSAMLAEEYILIVPFVTQLQSQLNEYNRALEYTMSFLSLPSDSSGLK